MKKKHIGTNKKVTSDDILNALDVFFRDLTYVKYRELKVEFPYTAGADTISHIDYWVIDIVAYGTPNKPRPRPPTTYSIEIKVNRKDFKKELKNPQKQRWALMYSNLFYYCCPKGLIKSDELPPYAGLLEYENGEVVESIKAPRRDICPPRWTFVASLLSNYNQDVIKLNRLFRL